MNADTVLILEADTQITATPYSGSSTTEDYESAYSVKVNSGRAEGYYLVEVCL